MYNILGLDWIIHQFLNIYLPLKQFNKNKHYGDPTKILQFYFSINWIYNKYNVTF